MLEGSRESKKKKKKVWGIAQKTDQKIIIRL